MSDLIDRLQSFATHGEPDLDAIEARATTVRRTRTAALVAAPVAVVVLAAGVTLSVARPPAPQVDPIAMDGGADAELGPLPRIELAREPSPDDIELELLVHEPVCADGEEDRTGPGVGFSSDASSIEVGLAYRLPGDADFCGDGTPTSIVIELELPVGDRTIVDSGTGRPVPIHSGDGVSRTFPEPVASDGPLNEATLSLVQLPGPDDTTIQLLAMEESCASGRTGEDRVVSSWTVTATTLEVTVGFTPQEMAFCPSHPPTPVTLVLDEPLGERVVVDASTGEPLRVSTPTPEPDLAAAQQAALERLEGWDPPTSYTIELELLCFECPVPQILHVTVADGVTTRVVAGDSGQDVTDSVGPEYRPTLAELKAMVFAAADDGTLTEGSLSVADSGRLFQFEAPSHDAVPAQVLGWAIYGLPPP